MKISSFIDAISAHALLYMLGTSLRMEFADDACE